MRIEGGRVVLARGEATGHAHVIEKAEGVRCYTLDEVLYVRIKQEVEVTHPEHQTLLLPPGTYQIDQVREYDYLTEEDRRVRD